MGALERLGLRADAPTASAAGISQAQAQTSEAFSYKWQRRDTYESPAVQNAARDWLVQRYCDGDASSLRQWLDGGRKIILDAGCGAGHSALLLFADLLREHDYLGVDISDAVEIARQRFREAGYPGDFLQADLQALPIPSASVDIIFSEGVLHHTDNTEASFHALAHKLKPDGLFMFYVYAKKGPVREFTDDHIRQRLCEMDDNQAWEALKPLTKLGIALGQLHAEVEVPEDIPLLDIPKGRIDVQRLFYWHFCKAYYRPEQSLEEMNHINFDWYRPLHCHRHTSGEIDMWLDRAGLKALRICTQSSGITVVARRGEQSGRSA